MPREVIAYASRLLPAIAPDLTEATSIRESAGDFAIRTADPAELTAATLTACDDALTKEGSIGLIAAESRIPELRTALEATDVPCLAPGEKTSPEARLTLVPATLAKGLEYDYVVLDEPAAIVDGEPDERTGLRRLYVCLTRAVSGLTVVHAAGLPEQLGEG